jgi:hypothetical protein
MSEEFYEKLREISKFLEREGEGISYISNKPDTYTIGSRKYSEKIVEYLDKNVEGWEGSEPQLKEKKGKSKQEKKVGYLWKIPVS